MCWGWQHRQRLRLDGKEAIDHVDAARSAAVRSSLYHTAEILAIAKKCNLCPYQTYMRMGILRWSDRPGSGRRYLVAIGGIECD